jgi:hypothetical protein
MTLVFRQARRENVPLLIGVAGGTGSGKTMSALMLAKGLAGGHPFAGIDTENRRMNHYADRFPELRVAQLEPPFRPMAYTAAIDAAVEYLEAQGVPSGSRVVVVDSMSHEWAGDGGCLDWVDEIKKGKESMSPVAWATVKRAHKKMVTRLLQIDAHIIVALRAETKVDIVKGPNGIEFVPKKTLRGGSLDGWVPISEKSFPFEITASFLLTADAPGVPLPLKLEEDHRAFVPLDRPLNPQVGQELAAWAAGAVGTSPAAALAPAPPPDPDEIAGLVTLLLAHGRERGNEKGFDEAIAANQLKNAGDIDAHVEWLRGQIARCEAEPPVAPPSEVVTGDEVPV